MWSIAAPWRSRSRSTRTRPQSTCCRTCRPTPGEASGQPLYLHLYRAPCRQAAAETIAATELHKQGRVYGMLIQGRSRNETSISPLCSYQQTVVGRTLGTSISAGHRSCAFDAVGDAVGMCWDMQQPSACCNDASPACTLVELLLPGLLVSAHQQHE